MTQPTRPDVSIVSSGHDVADARLHREVEAAVAAGLDVEVLGLGSASDGPAGAAVTTRPRPRGVAARLALALAQPWRARGRVLLTLDPDVVPSALVAARLRRRRLVVDVHEDYVALTRDRGWARGAVGRAARAGVRGVLAAARRADLVVVADEHVPPRTAPARLVVRNATAGTYLPAPTDPGPVPRALYIGDVRRSRGLFVMLAAIEAAPGWELDVVGPVAPADQAELGTWVATSPAVARVRFHGRRPPEQAWALARGAWVGLSLLDDTPAFRDAVPSKLYEYLAAGLAVATTPLPRAAAIVTESAAGVVVPDADALSATLRGWAEQPASLLPLRAAAVTWSEAALAGPSGYDVLAQRLRALAGAAPQRSTVEVE
ncbi:MAG TPA: glycosyltransferase [Kineosporiaceae bacterium]|nr:glycosyltransferase [Kineosporiaceae bacterium]